MPRHTVIKLTKSKDKKKILKATNYTQENPHKTINSAGHDLFKVMKGESLQPGTLYPASLMLRF